MYGRPEGAGIEMLALSTFASDVPASAYCPFRLVDDISIEADDSL